MFKKALNVFKGRINRKHFFLAHFVTLLLLFFPIFIFVRPWSYAFLVISPLALIFALSLQIRRLHDIGLSGWIILAQILFVMIRLYEPLETISIYLNILYWLVLLFKNGEMNDNQYGSKIPADKKFGRVLLNLE